MDLYTFPITSGPEVESLQLRSHNLGLRNIMVPSGNSMGSKYRELAINGICNLYFAAYIWVKIIRMGNMHFLCQFLSVFIVTLSQNEPSESQKKNPVDKYTKESNGIALFLLQVGSI